MKMHLSSFLILGAVGATASCSGQYQVGTEPGAGGAGGGTSTGSSSTGGATVGASSTTGSTSATSTTSTTSSSTSATTGGGGSTTTGTGGQAGAPNEADASVSRCNFASDTNGSSSGPNASGTIVASRIHLFLDNDPTVPAMVPPPAQAAAPWAIAEAMAVLDAHRANGTQAAGLVRFLTNWLAVPLPEAGTSAARTWALKLLDPNATLSTLLAGSTADPRRSGVLTDRQWLTAHPRISLRGQWVATNLFCSTVPPPPPGIPIPPPQGPNQTRRENLAEQLAVNAACAGCHVLMDPPGFALEHFDAMGNYSDLDNGKPVDSSGTITQLMMLSFNSIEDLAPKLATSCQVALCFTNQLMNDAFVVSPSAQPKPFTETEANRVANDFANSNFSIRALVGAIVGSPAFLR